MSSTDDAGSAGSRDEATPGADSPGGETAETEYDSLAPLKTGLRYGIWGLGILTVLGLLIFWPKDGLPGLWGVLIGAGVGGAFILITAVVILTSVNLKPSATMAAVMGSWFLKMVAVLVVMAILREMDFYSKPALVTMLIGTIIAVLGSEVWGVMSTPTPYVEPARDNTDRK